MCGLLQMIRNTCDRDEKQCQGVSCFVRPSATPNNTGTGNTPAGCNTATGRVGVGTSIGTYTYNGPGSCEGVSCGLLGNVTNLCPDPCRPGASPLSGVPAGSSLELICTSNGAKSFYNGQQVG